jgi:hypothetical protein
MTLRLPVPLAVLALAAMAPLPAHAASTASDPLGCDATIHDPDSVLNAGELEPAVERTARMLDGDLRVRVEGAVDGDLEARLNQLIRQCSGWDAGDGELADDMVVVMFSTAEREASVFYGADQGPDLEFRWESAVDAMIQQFGDGDYTAGVEAGLRRLTSSASTVGNSSSDRDDSGGSFPTGWLVVGGIVLAAGVIYNKVRGYASEEDDDGGFAESGWYGGRRRRRWSSSRYGGSSFGSSRRSGSSSRRSSSSRGSRRAGGGSKKW